MKPNHLGLHYILELFDCDRALINNIEQMESLMVEAANIANATIVSKCFHQYSPHGISGTVVIKESHFNIHTWPEHGFAAIDLFTCGENLEADKAKDFLIEKFKANSFEFSTLKRGVLK